MYLHSVQVSLFNSTKMMPYISTLFFAFISFQSSYAFNENDTLVLVHVLFRHGDRTPDTPRYPTDPYINETYYPIGSGELTNKGKRREYDLGKLLRKKYHALLGPIYTPKVLMAYTNQDDRLQTSLQLVLAGLYPPENEQVWDSDLNWQPIPYNILQGKEARVLNDNCSDLMPAVLKYFQTKEAKALEEPYKKVLKYIAQHTGEACENFFCVYSLYFTLTTEQECGFPLPYWTRTAFPEPIKTIAAKTYHSFTATTKLRKMWVGYFIQDVVAKIESKLLGEMNETKIILYSGHESNIGTLLSALQIFDPQIPSYGSCVIFETHRKDEEYFVRILYHNATREEPYVLTLANCTTYCPFRKLVELVSVYYPDASTCEME